MKAFKAKNRHDASYYIDGILNQDRVKLSQAITITESHLESDKQLASQILQHVLPHTGNSLRIGITGVPGVGKSTFIEAFGMHLISLGFKVAILSIDPSSQRSKGSILGDKTRMEELSHSNHAYIRPSASGDTLGGVTNTTAESMLLCEAAGYTIILIETVGVGQSETAVHSMTDFFLLLMLAGAGDELQGIKKGIMEMADLIVIHKADSDNINHSKAAKSKYENALHLFASNESGWSPKVTTASSTQNTGIDTIWEIIQNYQTLTVANGYFQKQRDHQKIDWMYRTIENELKRLFYNNSAIKARLPLLEQQIIASELSPVKAALNIIDEYNKTKKNV